MTRDELVAAIRARARVLYEGVVVPHHSCGVAVAVALGRDGRPYQALRRGGITGAGTCGAVLAGQLVLGELLGDHSPGAPTTPALREAMERYQAEVARRLPRGPGGTLVCSDLVSPFADFQGAPRAAFCTDLAVTVAGIVAELLAERGVPLDPSPIRPA